MGFSFFDALIYDPFPEWAPMSFPLGGCLRLLAVASGPFFGVAVRRLYRFPPTVPVRDSADELL